MRHAFLTDAQIDARALAHRRGLGFRDEQAVDMMTLLVKLKAGETAAKEEFLQFLDGKIAKWWMPDDVAFVDDIPLGATGKIDKIQLRSQFGGG